MNVMRASGALGLGLSLSVALGLGACQQSATPAQASSPSGASKASAASAESAGSTSDGLTSGTVIARWTEGGEPKTLTYGELKDARKSTFLRLEQERYQTISREVEGYVMDRLLEAEAKKSGKSTQEYLKSLADAVSKEEVEQFYASNVAQGGKGPPLDQVEERIRQYLSMKDVAERVKRAADVRLTVPEPEVPVAEFNLADRPRKGPENAKVTIVEFSDFQCPYCARATKPVEDIVKEFPEQVRVYFLHYPLSFHKQAMPAAIASRCAQKQGKFWEMHDKIFENQAKIGDEDLEGHAKALSLDMKKFKACMKSPETEAFVRADMEQGNEAGVGGTPSFYINGKAHQGPPSVDTIRALVEG